MTYTSEPDLEAANGSALFAAAPESMVRYGGDTVALVSGTFSVADADAPLLRTTVPSFVHVAATDKASMNIRSIHAVLLEEIADKRLGTSLVLARLVDVLLVQTLRVNAALEQRARPLQMIRS